MSRLPPEACSLCHRIAGTHRCVDGEMRLFDGRNVSAGTPEEVAEAMRTFTGPGLTLSMPTAPGNRIDR